MPLHELEKLGATLFVKRTKVLYVSIALMLFGAIGMGLQMTESAQAVDSVAPALTDACKDYNFRVTHMDACGAAKEITNAPVPTPTNGTLPIAPGSTVVVDAGPIALGTNNH